MALASITADEPLGDRPDRFFGMWTKQQAEEFNRNLAEHRQIGGEMWE